MFFLIYLETFDGLLPQLTMDTTDPEFHRIATGKFKDKITDIELNAVVDAFNDGRIDPETLSRYKPFFGVLIMFCNDVTTFPNYMQALRTSKSLYMVYFVILLSIYQYSFYIYIFVRKLYSSYQ